MERSPKSLKIVDEQYNDVKHKCVVLILVHESGTYSLIKARLSDLSEDQLSDLMSLDGCSIADDEPRKIYTKITDDELLYSHDNEMSWNPIWKQYDTVKEAVCESENEVIAPEHIITFLEWA